MAEDVQRLLLQIDASATLLRQEVAKARNDIDGFASGAERRLSGLEGAFSGLGRGAGVAARALGGMAGGFLAVGQAAALAVNATREMQRLTAQLEVATGSSAAAGAAFSDLTKFAAETPYTLAQVTEAYIKLKNLGIEPTEERLRSFGNTSAAMGKDLMQFIEAVADASTGEFERLKEFGIRASKEGDKVRFTFQGVTKEVQFNANAITNYLEEIGRTKFGDAMAKQAATIDGKLSNLEDATAKLGRALGGLGIGNATGAGIQFLTNLINDAADATKGLGDGLTTLAKAAAELFDRAAGVDAPRQRGPSAETIAERRKREEGVIQQLPRGSAIRGQMEDEYRTRYGLNADAALFEEPEIEVAFSRSKFAKREAAANKARIATEKATRDALNNRRKGMTNRIDVLESLGLSPETTRRETQLVKDQFEGKPVDFATRAGRGDFDSPISDPVQAFMQAQMPIAQIKVDMTAIEKSVAGISSVKLISAESVAFADDFSKNLTSGLSQAIIYGQSLGDALVNSIKAAAAELVASGLLNLLSGGKRGTSFGDALGGLASIFGGARETGGPVMPGKAYVVGEKRPELFVPSSAGYIMPRVPSAQGGGGQQSVNVTVNPSPLFITTVAQGAQAAAQETLRKSTRQRMPMSAGV
jgi:hypothetical protein